MNTRVVESVLFAHRSGRNTIRQDVARWFKRAYVWVMFQRWIPAAVHRAPVFNAALLGAFSFANWITGQRVSMAGGLGKSNTLETDILKLIFTAVAIADLAENDTSSPLATLYCSLHTGGDPGDAASQTTNEIAYTGYARVGVARTAGGWTVSGNSVSPVANIDFGLMTAGAGGTVTYGAIGTLASGAGIVLYYGTVTPNISVVNGVIPRFTTASAVTED